MMHPHQTSSTEPISNELYLALVAEVADHGFRRNLHFIGGFKSLLEANNAVNCHCVNSSRTNNVRELENAIPTLTFNQSGGFVDIRKQYILNGSLLHSQHFWVQHFNISGGTLAGNVATPLYVVTRSLVIPSNEDSEGEGMEDEDEEVFHEEVVSVHWSFEDASRRSLNNEGMQIEDNAIANKDGTW
eukprot:CAMPEP_0181323680 /NCGR_PEP_ID=MMETSP1101-20121128/19927_1 /TAXON_ID=46948 /ORGANISM="Rhodomonas abbreviata, Strain Caron Lab Isolate" /LENGTH=186 /DNA_ID=CAMNT_0023431749 /DNA_START=147 /DNA_END=704 /DNA_ORIENTATION=+